MYNVAMSREEKKIKLVDLIDVEFLQGFQDVFANTMNVASIMVDDQGPITKPSNFTDFCNKYTRGSAEGYKRCNECDIRCGKDAAATGKPVIYNCHSGLTDFAVPIIVNGKHIASILGGQVLSAPPNEDHFRTLARELGINEEEYISALKKIKIVPLETIKAAANLLSFVANTISEISHKNIELIKKNERDNLNQKIMSFIINSFDIDETLSFICDEVAKVFNVQRSAIAVFSDHQNYEDCTIKKEYRISKDIKGVESLDNFKKVAQFWGNNLIRKGGVFAIDDVTNSNIPDYLRNSYETLGVKSIVGVAIRKDDDVWGILILSEYNNYRYWTEDEIDLLRTISDQIYIAIKQSELHNALKQNTANQNAILNNIPFMVWLKDSQGRLIAVNKTYAAMCKDSVENVIGKTDYDFFPKEDAELYIKDDLSVIEKRCTVTTEEKISGPEGAKWHETIKSPVYDDQGNAIGTVGMARDISERKEAEMELLSRQEQIIKANKREILLRKIFETIRSSLDIDKTLSFICEEAAKLLNVQRATIVQFPTADNYEQYTIRSEYKVTSEIKGLTSSEYITKAAAYWGNKLLNEGKILEFSNIQESDTPDYFKLCYKALGVKSMIGFPIKMGESKWGSLVLSEYNSFRNWTEQEKTLLETISDQIYIAIYQAELYQALKRNTANQNAILNNMPFMAWLKDDQSRLLAVNETFAKMCNDTIENILGKTDFDFFPNEEAKVYIEEDRLVIENRQTISSVDSITGPDGAKWHETFKSPVFDDKGNVIGTVGISQDITERKEAEIELLHRQEQIIKATKNETALRKIMSASVNTFDLKTVINSIVVETGKLFEADRCIFVEYDFEINSFNPIKDYTEYLSSDKIRSHTESMPNQTVIDAIIRLIKQGKVITVENVEQAQLMPESKKLLVNELSVKSYLLAPVYYGEINYGAVILHYVNDYKQFTEDEINMAQAVANQSAIVIHQAKLYSDIQKNEKYTRTIMDSIKDGIIIINENFTIESCNPAVECIWGYSIEEILNKNLDVLVYHNCAKEDKKSCLSKNVTKGIKKSGEEFPVEIDVSEIVFENKKLILLVVRDITERKRIEKMKNEFVSTVSHELRTPLTSIKGSLGLVTSGALGAIPEKMSKLIDIADSNCMRLTNLINDILDLEKIKAGKYEFVYEEIEINSLIDQSITLNQSYADQFGMKIKVVKLAQESFIKADRNRLIQVISNLFSNAVKFSKLGGEVIIMIECEDAQIKVSFIDNGIGIPDDAKHKIFQSFSQVDSSDTRSKGGTGLGLSICKLIVENMGGNIDFESVEKKGSTFFFTMPVIKEGSLKVEDGTVKEFSSEEDAW